MQVLLPLDQVPLLYYLPPDGLELKLGDLVKVPFRQKELVGMVYSFRMPEEQKILSKLKFAKEKIELPAISAQLMAYIDKVASYNLASLGSVMKMVIPIDPLENYKIKPNESKEAKIIKLSEAQQSAADYIVSKCLPKHSVTLLDGVTGSGKTEVYFSAIAKLLDNDPEAQILIMLPEIVLTSQSINRFKDCFGFMPSQWHSGTSPAIRKTVWHEVITGQTRMVTGARSALFLPFKKLALVIVDEEHESSYKQEDKVNYHARDMVVLRGYCEKIPILLCSATPSLETVLNCQNDKYQAVKLESRFGASVMPNVCVSDMRGKKLPKNNFISLALQNKLANNLAAAAKQSLLFLNRRGYAPLTVCKSCGYKCHCPNCGAWLVEHKATNNLVCHHCGYSSYLPKHCPECNTPDSFVACGPGVERIEEEVKLLLPQARVLHMTKDEVNTPKKAEQVIALILNREIDIIVGTQVMAKGHHFPHLSLVGVIDADIGLAGGDLRAAEKTYQLLHQVAGRAGRESQVGEVVIQTYQPDNVIIQALARHNREDFINYELEMRAQSHMPPYTKLTAIIISAALADKAAIYAKELVKIAPYHTNVQILGPVPAILAKLKRKYRYRILVKCPKDFNIQNYLQNWLERLKPHASLQVKVDIDPYYFN